MGVRLFDPNIPADEKEQEKERIYPDVRKAESRYMPVMLRDTMEATGQWGQVRVLPADASSVDVLIDGRILESSGRELKLAIKATDAAGQGLAHRRNTAGRRTSVHTRTCRSSRATRSTTCTRPLPTICSPRARR